MKFPNKKDLKLAEFIGILLGGGCLGKNRLRVSLNGILEMKNWFCVVGSNNPNTKKK